MSPLTPGRAGDAGAPAGGPVRFDRDGAVGVITLAAPPLNLFDEQVTLALVAAIEHAATTADLRALLVRAEGDAFSGGVDVHNFQGLTARDGAALALIERIVAPLEAMPFPTLASVHALCLTAGFELALGCDMIWAGESVRFGLVEAVVGVTPLMGGTQRVAERAGPARARELVMTGGLYDAATLERWNVVNRVLPDAELAEKSMRFAHRLAAGPTQAHALTKRLVRAATDHGVSAADAATRDVAARIVETEDFKHGVRSFLEQGPGNAEFAGR